MQVLEQTEQTEQKEFISGDNKLNFLNNCIESAKNYIEKAESQKSAFLTQESFNLHRRISFYLDNGSEADI